MSNEERVVLTAELRDEASAPLSRLNRNITNATQSMLDSNQRQTRSAAQSSRDQTRAMADTGGAVGRLQKIFNTGTSTIGKAYNNLTSRVANSGSSIVQSMGGVGRSVGNVAQAGVQQLNNFRSGFRNSSAAASSFSGVMGTVGGTLRTAWNGASDALPSVISGLESVGGAAARAGSAIASEIGAGVSTAVKTVGTLTAAIAGIAIKGGISRMVKIEDAQAKLAGLGSTAEEVDVIMKSAMDSVNGTAYGLDEAATTAAMAVAAGIKPGKELTEYLTLVADASSIAGNSMGEMGQMMNKVQNAGKVTTLVLNQFGIHGVGALNMLAKAYKVPVEEMQDMVTKGQISAEEFNAVLKDNLGGAALESGKTTSGAFKNMRAALSRTGESLVKGFYPLFLTTFNGVMDTFNRLNKRIKAPMLALGEGFTKKVTPHLEAFGERADKVFERVGLAVMALSALFIKGDFGSNFRKAFGVEEDSALVNTLFNIREGLASLKPHLAPIVAGLLALGGGKFAKLLGPSLARFVPVFNPVLAIIATLIATSPELRAALGGAVEQILPILGMLVDAMAPLLPIAAEVATALILFASAIIEKLNPALPVLVPLVLGLVVGFKAAKIAMVLWKGAIAAWMAIQAGYQTALGISTVMTKAQASAAGHSTRAFILMKATQYGVATAMAVATAAQWLWNAAMSANPIGLIVLAIAALVGGIIWAYNNVEWFRDGVDAALVWVVDAFHNVVAWLDSVFGPAIAAIGAWFTDVFTAIVGWWNTTFMPAIFAIADWFIEVFTGIVDFVVGVWDQITYYTDVFVRAFRLVIDQIGVFFEDIFAGVVGFFVDTWDNIVGFTQDFVNGFLDVLGAIGQWFVDVFSPIINGLVDVFRPVFQWIERFVWNAMTIILTLFYALVDLWNGVLKPALDVLAGWFGDVLGWIGEKIRGYVGMWIDFFGMIVDWWNDTLVPIFQLVGFGIMLVANWIGTKIRDYVGMWIDFFGMIVDWWNDTLVPIFQAVGLAFEVIMAWIGSKIDMAVLAWQIAFGMIVDWWNTTLVPVFEAVGLAFEIIMAWIGEKIDLAVLAWQIAFGMVISWWNETLLPALQAVGDFFSMIFNWIYDAVISPVIDFIVGKFNELMDFWNTVLSPAIDIVASWFSDKISNAIDGVAGFIDKMKIGFDVFIQFWTTKLKPVVDAIVAAFEKVSGAVGGAIDKVKEVAGGALDTGKDFISNPLGGIQDWMGIEKDGDGRGVMPTRNSGGGVAGFAGGGVLPGYAPGVDSIPAVLSRGEGVAVPELVRAIGPRNFMTLNHMYSGGRAAGSGPARATVGALLGSVAAPVRASGGAVVQSPRSGLYTPKNTPTRGGGGEGRTVVTVEAGAVQLLLKPGPDGRLSDEAVEQVKEVVEDLFDSKKKRTY